MRTLRQVGDLTMYRSFLIMLAARSGQLLNLNDLSRDLGVALNTIKSWLSILEATYQVIILRPWFSNTGKRLVKTPKVYFTDTGTLCHLTGLKEVDHAWKGPMSGALFETALVVEVYKSLIHRARDPRLSFWRTSDGREVDLVVDDAMKLVPLEIKSTATPRPAHARFVVHSGERRLPLGGGVMGVPFGDV